MWSKAGKFMEGIHVVGDILTKISANLGDKFTRCIVIYVLIFMGLSMCVYKCS